jgi:hypothetical protein
MRPGTKRAREMVDAEKEARSNGEVLEIDDVVAQVEARAPTPLEDPASVAGAEDLHDDDDEDYADLPALGDAEDSDDEDMNDFVEHAARSQAVALVLDQATPVTTPAKSRGRPKKPAVVVFNDAWPDMDFSLTVASNGQHVPPPWLPMTEEYCKSTKAHRYLLSFERGGNAEHLHIQGVVTWKALTTDDSIKLIVKQLKEALGVRRGDGQKWCALAYFGYRTMLRASGWL